MEPTTHLCNWGRAAVVLAAAGLTGWALGLGHQAPVMSIHLSSPGWAPIIRQALLVQDRGPFALRRIFHLHTAAWCSLLSIPSLSHPPVPRGEPPPPMDESKLTRQAKRGPILLIPPIGHPLTKDPFKTKITLGKCRPKKCFCLFLDGQVTCVTDFH